jgi:hypothetical protein
METTTFCHQIPKLVQDKIETVSDFAKQCITKMREFMDSIQALADGVNTAMYLAHTASDKTQARENKHRVMIDALAKGCFLTGVDQAIKVTLMQK